MSLFAFDPAENILPHDGIVNYFGPVIEGKEANDCLQKLFDNIAWKNDEAFIYGKHYITKRKVAWYGDSQFDYTYSNTTKTANLWTPELLKLKILVEKMSGHQFNSCLLNLYHDGSEGMAWHSDDESALGKDTVIASMSFGAQRKFSFKHKETKETVSIMLEHGSLLVMKGTTQTHWLHSIPKSVKIKSPRVNLTFRTIII
jgi:alkylated DNA repair dioxygenase AlkB